MKCRLFLNIECLYVQTPAHYQAVPGDQHPHRYLHGHGIRLRYIKII